MKEKWQHAAEEVLASKETNEEENDNIHSCMRQTAYLSNELPMCH